MDTQLSTLLDRFKAYFEVQADGKICCLPNGHCFPPRYDVIHAFINGKRFPQIKKRYDAEQNLSQFEPWIAVSKNFPTMLYCTMTGQLLEKSVEAVRRHMAGKKYTYNKAKHDLGTMVLKPEPDIEDVLGIKKKGKKGKGEGAESEDDMEEGTEGEDELDEDESMDEDAEAGPSKKRMRLEQGEGEEEEEEEEVEFAVAAVSDMEQDYQFGDEEQPSSSGQGEGLEGEPDEQEDAATTGAAAIAATLPKTAQRGKKPAQAQQAVEAQHKGAQPGSKGAKASKHQGFSATKGPRGQAGQQSQAHVTSSNGPQVASKGAGNGAGCREGQGATTKGSQGQEQSLGDSFLHDCTAEVNLMIYVTMLAGGLPSATPAQARGC